MGYAKLYLRGSVEVLAKITLLKDQRFVETWNWSVSIPRKSMPWSVPAIVSKLESVIGSKIVDSLADVNSVVRCSPEIKLQARAKKEVCFERWQFLGLEYWRFICSYS